MKNKSHKIKNFIKTPYFLIGLISVIAISAISIFAIYLHWNATKESTTIMNLSSMVPNYVKREIESQLYQNVVKNSKNYTENRSVINATVRSNTLNAGTKDDGEGYGDFIVDIDTLEQNYHVFYSYRNEQDFSVTITCVSADESIYPQTSCQAVGDDTNYDAYEEVDALLPYIGFTANNKRIFVNKSSRYAYTNKPYYTIEINACGSEEEIAAGLETFKTYLENQEIDTAQLTFETRNKCYLQY